MSILPQRCTVCPEKVEAEKKNVELLL